MVVVYPRPGKSSRLPRLRIGKLSLNRVRNRALGSEGQRPNPHMINALDRVTVHICYSDIQRAVVELQVGEGINHHRRVVGVCTIGDLEREILAMSRPVPYGVQQMINALQREFHSIEDNDEIVDADKQHSTNLEDMFYLDTCWSDKQQDYAKPMWLSELYHHKEWQEIKEVRQNLVDKYTDEEERLFYDSTYNTAEREYDFARDNVHDIEERNEATERFDIIASQIGMSLNEPGEMPFEDFVLTLMLESMECCEVSEDGFYHQKTLSMSLTELLENATANTMMGGTTVRGKMTDNELKSTHFAVATAETIMLVNMASNGIPPYIPPTTLKTKDERVKGHHLDNGVEKEAKKIKLFNPMPTALSKADYMLTGKQVRQFMLRPDLGYFIGVSNIDGHLDSFVRHNIALQLGRPVLRNDDEDNTLLRNLKALEGDYVSFEFRHHPLILLIKNLAKYASLYGCMHKAGFPQPELAKIIGVNVESEILTTVRPGGSNICYEPPPVNYGSGRPNTLNDNHTKNTEYTLHSAKNLQRKTGRVYTPKEVNALVATMRMGDDTNPLDLPVVREVYGNITACSYPAEFKMGRAKMFLAEIDDNHRNTNDAASFCKQFFTMEPHTNKIVFRRDYKGLFKVFKGNTSSIDPEKLRQAARSHMISAHRAPRAQAFIKEFDEYLSKFTEGRVKNVKHESRPDGFEFKVGGDQALDSADRLTPLPTPEQVTQLLNGANGPLPDIRIRASYGRTIQYGVPLDY